MGALSDKVDHDPMIFFFLPTESISWTEGSLTPLPEKLQKFRPVWYRKCEKQTMNFTKQMIDFAIFMPWLGSFFFFFCVWKNHTLRCFQSMNAHKLKLNLTVNRTWILGKFLKVRVNYRKCGKNKQRNNNEIHWINDWFYYIYALIEIFLR